MQGFKNQQGPSIGGIKIDNVPLMHECGVYHNRPDYFLPRAANHDLFLMLSWSFEAFTWKTLLDFPGHKRLGPQRPTALKELTVNNYRLEQVAVLNLEVGVVNAGDAIVCYMPL
jgi:hypothetical protein